MPTQTLIIWLVIGLVAGWLASLIVGGGRGLLYYLVIGLLGAFVGGFLFNFFHIYIGIGNPIVHEIVTATIGAVVLVLVARAIR